MSIVQVPPIKSDFPEPGLGLEDSYWYPDSSGIKTFTENTVDEAIAHRNQLLDELPIKLEALNNELAKLANIPQITDAELPPLSDLPQVEDFIISGDAPVKPTDIDFNRPALPVITEITPNFPTQSEYSSSLLDDLVRILDGLINNFRQTGLNPVIEQQIWDRGRERTRAAAQGTIDAINRSFARAGWNLPQGDQVEAIYQANEQLAEADITESRNIAVAQADLEQKNLQFAIQQAATLEIALNNAHNAFLQLAVEAEVKRVELLAEVNRLNVDVFKNLVDAGVAYAEGKIKLYQADANVYQTLIEAEGKRIDAQIAVQKAEIDYSAKQADLTIEVAKANIATLIAQKELLIEGQKAEAQLLAQVAAGITSGVSVGAHISGSSSYLNATPTIISV